MSGGNDENDPTCWECITGTQEQFANGTATVHDGGYGGFNQTLTEYEQDESTLAERTHRRWLATDPRMRVGFSRSGQVFVPPEYNEYIMDLGPGDDKFFSELHYLEEMGEDLNAYSIAELDNIFVRIRFGYSLGMGLCGLSIQHGSTIGTARINAKISKSTKLLADEAHSTLDPIAQKYKTTAVGELEDGSLAIASSDKYVPGPQKKFAEQNNLKVINGEM